jgi:molybdopterin-containing oxidoreductase family membrane subunit
MALLPGWHSTLFAPFFVDGAILSGFAMVLVLVLPMRHYFRLHAYITERHLDALAQLLLVTSLVLTYFYICDAFTAWYSGDLFERTSLFWRVTGTHAPLVIAQYVCNSFAPLVLFSGRARRAPVTLFVVSVLVLIGMWLERFNIIVPSHGHDFYPYTWGIFVPALVDTTITIGSFGFFFLLFLGFVKLMPSVSIAEVKETLPVP